MKNRILLGLATVALSPISINAQAALASGYSESRAYVPRVLEADKKKSNRKKKEHKEYAKIPPVSTVAGTNETSNSLVIPVAVFDAKRTLIKDLRQNEFQVFINDVEADVVVIEKNAQPHNIFLLIDMSPSADPNLKETKGVLDSIVKTFDPSNKIIVAQFNEQVKVLSELTSDRSEIEKAIKRLKMANGTSIYEAVDKVSSEFTGNLTGRTVVVVITDGVDTTSRKADFATSLEAVEKTNLTVFPVYLDTFGTNKPRFDSLPPGLRQAIENLPAFRSGVAGTTVKEYETGRHYLNDLIQLSGGRAISNANSAQQAMPSIGEQLNSEYLLTVKPRSPMRIGERATVKVRVARPDLVVWARGSIIPTE